MSICIDIIFFYFPVLLGFFEILFYRRCVASPKIPKVSWFGLLLFFVPGLGAMLAYVFLGCTIVFIATKDIRLDENRRFVKNWLLK